MKKDSTSESSEAFPGSAPAWSGVPLKINIPGRAPLIIVPVAVEKSLNGSPPRDHPYCINIPVELLSPEISTETRFVLGPSSELITPKKPNPQKKSSQEPRSRPSKKENSSKQKIPSPARPSLQKNTTAPENLFQKTRLPSSGFWASLIFHALLIVIAISWISVKTIRSPEPVPDAFVTGSGGNAREVLSSVKRTARRYNSEAINAPKIVSKSTHASFALPEIKNQGLQSLPLKGELHTADVFSNGNAGGLGTGTGGGIGTGTGIGIGGGKNFVSKFSPRKMLGAQVYAEKIAVYLDNSGSMKPYLAQVKKEIYEKFPDADIFEFRGAKTEVHDGEIFCGKGPKTKKNIAENRSKIKRQSPPEKLSNKGNALYKKYAENFILGSVGAWTDILIDEGYDALVIFSDFYDGLRQIDTKHEKTLYADSVYKPQLDDKRRPKDLLWEKNWKNKLSRNNAPKLYLFTIGIEPQKFWKESVEISQGAITDLRHLKKKSSTKSSGKESKTKESAEKEAGTPKEIPLK